MFSKKKFTIPSMEQRKSQIDMLNFIDKERRDSKEFLFPDENLLHHRRRPSADHSATQSEDDESGNYEVRMLMASLKVSNRPTKFHYRPKVFFPVVGVEEAFVYKIQFPQMRFRLNCIHSNVYLIFRFLSPQSYMVIEFEKNINRVALHWIVDKIRMKKSDGGAQLMIRKEPSLR